MSDTTPRKRRASDPMTHIRPVRGWCPAERTEGGLIVLRCGTGTNARGSEAVLVFDSRAACVAFIEATPRLQGAVPAPVRAQWRSLNFHERKALRALEEKHP